MLDMGTGGGEFLASLPERPPLTCATEAYPPNMPIARDRLAPMDPGDSRWSLPEEVAAFERAGFELLRAEEQLLETAFYDIGAVVYYLKVIEWQIPDFSVEKYRERLLAMHQLK